MEEASCLRVNKRMGEKTILLMKHLNLLNSHLILKKKDPFLLIPISRNPTIEEIFTLKDRLQEVDITKDRFKKRKIRVKTLYEALEDRFSIPLLNKIPRSMDIIGQIAIVKVPIDLKDKKSLLGKAIMKVNSSVKTVLAKAGDVHGKFRLREFEIIAGNNNTETMYREHGCIYHLNPTKVYFSPRLSQERWRITQQIFDGEVIIDMFAGVGPYSIQIAKKHSRTKVYAIDLNPNAIQYLKRNIVINKVSNVFPILGDAREIIEKKLSGRADRVIMNLPSKALDYIDVACKGLRTSGGIINYYAFEAQPKALEKAQVRLKKAILKTGKDVKRFINSRFVRPKAPYEWQIAIDVLVS